MEAWFLTRGCNQQIRTSEPRASRWFARRGALLTIDPAQWVNRTNVLAVEVHQQATPGTDVCFDAQSTATLQSAPITDALSALVPVSVAGRWLF